MTRKAAAANGVTPTESGYSEIIEGCLREMSQLRKRMKGSDARIRKADASIRRSLDETRSILRHVQTTR
jgi:hypothetical protein